MRLLGELAELLREKDWEVGCISVAVAFTVALVLGEAAQETHEHSLSLGHLSREG